MDLPLPFLPELPLLVRVLAATALTYAYVIVLVRVSGKRTAASLTSFDWILNVAVGSLVAVAMTSPDKVWPTLASITLVVLLQYIVSKLAFHSDFVSRAVTAEPSLLVHQGRFMRDAMARTRVNEDEIAEALRSAGLTTLEQAGAVVMDPTGSLTVLKRDTVEAAQPTDFALRELHGMRIQKDADSA